MKEKVQFSKGRRVPTKEQSQRHTEEHNSRNTNRYRNWFFTLNGYTEEDVLKIQESTLISKYAFQEETGESGNKHLQGVISLTQAKTFRYVKEHIFEKAHWERCKNVAAARNYCTKLKTRTGETWVKGYRLKNKPTDPLKGKTPRPFQAKILKLIEEDPDDRTIYWFWEEKGNTGKTTLCKHLALKHDALIVGGRHQDAYFGIAEALKRNKHIHIVVFDIPRSNRKPNFATGSFSPNISYTAIEGIKNGIFFSTKYESKSCVFDSPHVIVFSNYPPNREELSQDRWKITEIKSL